MADLVQSAIRTYLAINPPQPGSMGPAGVNASPELVAAAVAQYLADHPAQAAPAPQRGPEGARGPLPRSEDLERLVRSIFSEMREELRGPRGYGSAGYPGTDGAPGPAGATGPAGPAGSFDPVNLGTALYEAATDVVVYQAMAVLGDETVGYAALGEPESIFGLSLETKLAGQQLRVRHAGVVVNPGWAWTPGQPVYALDGGALSQTSDAMVSARLGLALTTTSILVRGEPPIFIG